MDKPPSYCHANLMTGESGSIYAQDLAGELCDEWVRAGFGFEQRADGGIEKILTEHLEASAAVTLGYNQALVSEAPDVWGRPAPCVTVDGFSEYATRARRPAALMARLMAELPTDYLVYRAEPVGIRLQALPDVQKIVELAYTTLPRNAKRYPEGAMVLWGADRYELLNFFRAVLTPPDQEPALLSPTTPVGAIPGPQPSASPPARPEASQAPKAPVPPAEQSSDRYLRLGLIVAGDTFKVTAGASLGSLVGERLAENSYNYDTKVLAFLALVCTIGAIASHFAIKDLEK